MILGSLHLTTIWSSINPLTNDGKIPTVTLGCWLASFMYHPHSCHRHLSHHRYHRSAIQWWLLAFSGHSCSFHPGLLNYWLAEDVCDGGLYGWGNVPLLQYDHLVTRSIIWQNSYPQNNEGAASLSQPLPPFVPLRRPTWEFVPFFALTLLCMCT